MISRLAAVILSVTLLFPAVGEADEWFADIDFGGFLKTSNFYLDQIPNQTDEGLISSQRLRLELSGQLAGEYDFEIAAEQQLLWSDPPELINLPGGLVNQRFDLEKSWNRNGRFESQLQLDRLNLQGEFKQLQWTLGRQAIGFGRISLFSPLDVIAPFPPDAIDVDVRPGVDALKLVRYFGLAGQVGAVVVLGEEKEQNSYLLTLGENVANVDLLGLLGSLRDRLMLGAGIAGEIGELGLKLEVVGYRGKEVGLPGGDLYEQFFTAALEAWYRFDMGLVLLAEYFYNGPGSKDPERYPLVADSAPFREGLSFLLGRHYLLLGPSYELHPLLTVQGLVIHNLQDRSSLLRPQLAVSLSDNLQLDLFWTFTRGKKNRRDPVFGFPVVRSEFGAVGESGGFLLRYYF